MLLTDHSKNLFIKLLVRQGLAGMAGTGGWRGKARIRVKSGGRCFVDVLSVQSPPPPSNFRPAAIVAICRIAAAGSYQDADRITSLRVMSAFTALPRLLMVFAILRVSGDDSSKCRARHLGSACGAAAAR